MIWEKAKEPRPSLSSPEENGWFYKEGALKPKLMNQEEVSASCLQLAFCGCSNGNSCINCRCTCVRMSLGCAKGCKYGEKQETFNWTKRRCNVLCAAYVLATADFCYRFLVLFLFHDQIMDTSEKTRVIIHCPHDINSPACKEKPTCLSSDSHRLAFPFFPAP